jgi:hypothetical protein
MSEITISNLSFKEAKDVLAKVYDSDNSSSYFEEFGISGSILTGIIKKDFELSRESGSPKFRVNINSRFYFEETLKEMFS